MSAAPGPSRPTREPASPLADAGVVIKSAPRWAVVGIFLMLLIGGIAYARTFLMPIVLALLLALVFSPVRRFLHRYRIPSIVSAILIVGMLLAVLVTILVLLAEPVRNLLQDAPGMGVRIEEKIGQLLGPANAVVEVGEQVEALAESEREDVEEVVIQRPGPLTTIASVAPPILGQAVFTMVLLLFLLATGDMFYEKIVHAMPTFRDKRQAISIGYDIEQKLSRYLLTVTLINIGLGTAIGLAMAAIGVPNPLLFGVLGFALNYIPYLGLVCGAGFATVVGLIHFDSAAYALVPGAAYIGLNIIEAQFVTPYLVGRRLEMNPVVVFISIALWAWLWSIVGMLVAVPLLVAIRTFCEHVPRLHGVRDFLSSRGSEMHDTRAAAQSARSS